jgi:hypothetical protein
MPDEYDEADDEIVEQNSSVIRALRKEAKEGKEAKARVAVLERENAIAKANLGLTDAQTEALLRFHEGDTTPEALLATKVLLYGTAEAPAETPQVPAEEQAAHRRMAEATAAAQPSEAHTTTLDEEIAAAPSAEALEAILRREGMVAGEQ